MKSYAQSALNNFRTKLFTNFTSYPGTQKQNKTKNNQTKTKQNKQKKK